MKKTQWRTAPRNLTVAPATLASDSVTLVWDKPDDTAAAGGYRIYRDGISIMKTRPAQTHATIRGLTAATTYTFRVESMSAQAGDTKGWSCSSALTVRTKPHGVVIDVTQAPYLADATGKTLATTALQSAIDACPAGGMVWIPADAVILTGAIDLTSNLTLRIDGKLQGSSDPVDYTFTSENRKNYKGSINRDGLILTRYEGWEMYCYRSLINAGYLNTDNRREVTCENIRICGRGTVYGGGNALGTAMKQIYADREQYPRYVSDGIGGRRVRGRLIGLIQCKNVHLTGITVENPPCWTIHILYCDTVTTHGLTIKSRGIDNGDGWDPDSSRNLMIFDTTFDTGDDCIAVKSGKNPEGNAISLPTENVRIFDLQMIGGHGMAIGSEESGGVENVYLHDCIIRDTNYGLELKAHPSRGGYIKHLVMEDCVIDRFLAHSVDYNADGTAAPSLPYFGDITIKNTMINGTGRAVELIGFTRDDQDRSDDHYVRGIMLENVTLGSQKDKTKEIYLKKCRDLTFKRVRLANGDQPLFTIDKKTVHHLRINDE
ncbi:MAG: glycoside hydrolase family 28 protein [Sporolactobacillus sp.]|jgi:exo-poly-alpha-galacturonosidase|nr:glycoside hydrolase family 28 protein [Sporolactobacillus sp.]